MRIVPGETQTYPYEKPQDALRAGVLQMMHNYHRGSDVAIGKYVRIGDQTAFPAWAIVAAAALSLRRR
jgi:hypothetical protein